MTWLGSHQVFSKRQQTVIADGLLQRDVFDQETLSAAFGPYFANGAGLQCSSGKSDDIVHGCRPVFAITSQLNSSAAPRLVGLTCFADLPIIADRTWVKWQKRVTVKVGGNCGRRCSSRLQHFLVVLEYCSNHVIDEVIR